MPLPADGRLVSCLPQCRGQGQGRAGERCVGVGLAFWKPGWATPCHQGHPRRITHRINIVLLHPDSAVSHPIQVGGLDLRAMVAHVPPAQVVGQDEDDVGSGRRVSSHPGWLAAGCCHQEQHRDQTVTKSFGWGCFFNFQDRSARDPSCHGHLGKQISFRRVEHDEFAEIGPIEATVSSQQAIGLSQGMGAD